jgi:hypothetical protein
MHEQLDTANRKERRQEKTVCGAKLCGAKTTGLFAPKTPDKKPLPTVSGDNVTGFAKVGPTTRDERLWKLYQAGKERLRPSCHKSRLGSSLLFLVPSFDTCNI